MELVSSVNNSLNKSAPPQKGSRSRSPRSPTTNKSCSIANAALHSIKDVPKEEPILLKPAVRQLEWNEAYLTEEEIKSMRDFLEKPRNILRKDGGESGGLQLSITLEGLLHSFDDAWGLEDRELFGSQILDLKSGLAAADDLDLYIPIRLETSNHRAKVTDFIFSKVRKYLKQRIENTGSGFAKSAGNYADNYIWNVTDIDEKDNDFLLIQLGNGSADVKSAGDKIDLMFGFDIAEKGIFRVGSGRISLTPFLDGETDPKGFRVYCLCGTVEEMRSDAQSKELHELRPDAKRQGLKRYLRYIYKKGYRRQPNLESSFCQRLVRDYRLLSPTSKINKCTGDVFKDVQERFSNNMQGRQIAFMTWSHIIDDSSILPESKVKMLQMFYQYTLQSGKDTELVKMLSEALLFSASSLQNRPKHEGTLSSALRTSFELAPHIFVMSPFSQPPFETFIDLLVRWKPLDQKLSGKRIPHSTALNWLKAMTQKSDKEECLIEVIKTMFNLIKTSEDNLFVQKVQLRDFYRFVIVWNEKLASKLELSDRLDQLLKELKQDFSKQLKEQSRVLTYYFEHGPKAYPQEMKKRVCQPFVEDLVDKLCSRAAPDYDHFFINVSSVHACLSDEGELVQGEMDFSELAQVGEDQEKWKVFCNTLLSKYQTMLLWQDSTIDVMVAKWMMIHQALDPKAEIAQKMLPLLVRMMLAQESKENRIGILTQINRVIFADNSPEAQSGRDAASALIQWLKSPSDQNESTAYEAFIAGLMRSEKLAGVQIAYQLLTPLNASRPLPVLCKVLSAMSKHDALYAQALSDFFILYDQAVFAANPSITLSLVHLLLKGNKIEIESRSKLIAIAQKQSKVITKQAHSIELTVICVEIVQELASKETKQAHDFFMTALRQGIVIDGSPEFDRAFIAIIKGSAVESAMVHFALQRGLLTRAQFAQEKALAIFGYVETILSKEPSKESVQQAEKVIIQCEKSAEGGWNRMIHAAPEIAREVLYRLSYEISRGNVEKGQLRLDANEQLPASSDKGLERSKKAAEYRALTYLVLADAEVKTKVWKASAMLTKTESQTISHSNVWIEKRRSVFLKMVQAFRASLSKSTFPHEEKERIAQTLLVHYRSAKEQHLMEGYFEGKEDLYECLHQILCATKNASFYLAAEAILDDSKKDCDLRNFQAALIKMRTNKALFLARIGESTAALESIQALRQENALSTEQLMALHLAMIKSYTKVVLYEDAKEYLSLIRAELNPRSIALAHLAIAQSIVNSDPTLGIDAAQEYLKTHSKEIPSFTKAAPKVVQAWAKTCHAICVAHLSRGELKDLHFVYNMLKTAATHLSPSNAKLMPELELFSKEEDLKCESDKGVLGLTQTPTLLGNLFEQLIYKLSLRELEVTHKVVTGYQCDPLLGMTLLHFVVAQSYLDHNKAKIKTLFDSVLLKFIEIPFKKIIEYEKADVIDRFDELVVQMVQQGYFKDQPQKLDELFLTMRQYFFTFDTPKGNSRAIDYVCGLAKKQGSYDRQAEKFIRATTTMINSWTSGTIKEKEEMVWGAYKALRFLETEIPEFKTPLFYQVRVSAYENVIFTLASLPTTSTACLANDIFLFAYHHQVFGHTIKATTQQTFTQTREAVVKGLQTKGMIESRCTLSMYELVVDGKTCHRNVELYYSSFPPLFDEEEEALKGIVGPQSKEPEEQAAILSTSQTTSSSSKKKKKKKKSAQNISSD